MEEIKPNIIPAPAVDALPLSQNLEKAREQFILYVRDTWAGEVLTQADNTEWVSTKVAALREMANNLVDD